MINIIEQNSFQDGQYPWIEFYPEVSGLTLSIPEWTFRARGMGKVFAAASHAFVPDAVYGKDVALFLTPDGYELQTTLLDGDHRSPPPSVGFDEQVGAPRVLWFTLPAGCTDLADVKINVLRSIER